MYLFCIHIIWHELLVKDMSLIRTHLQGHKPYILPSEKRVHISLMRTHLQGPKDHKDHTFYPLKRGHLSNEKISARILDFNPQKRGHLSNKNIFLDPSGVYERMYVRSAISTSADFIKYMYMYHSTSTCMLLSTCTYVPCLCMHVYTYYAVCNNTCICIYAYRDFELIYPHRLHMLIVMHYVYTLNTCTGI